MRLRVLALPGMLGAVLAGVVAVVPAGAARSQSVRCVGTADYCGATVSIAGRPSTRVVTVTLTDTNLQLAGVRAIPAASRKGFSITAASFRLGGSQFRFTLNLLRSNPARARIVLLFAAGGAVAKPAPSGLKALRQATAFFSVGSGMRVRIVGGGGGTSNCTRDETNADFTTKGNNEAHVFGFDSKGSGSCFFEPSWSDFKVSVSDPVSGSLVGSGTLRFGQRSADDSYFAVCSGLFEGNLSCRARSYYGTEIEITRK